MKTLKRFLKVILIMFIVSLIFVSINRYVGIGELDQQIKELKNIYSYWQQFTYNIGESVLEVVWIVGWLWAIEWIEFKKNKEEK